MVVLADFVFWGGFLGEKGGGIGRLVGWNRVFGLKNAVRLQKRAQTFKSLSICCESAEKATEKVDRI